MNSDTSTDRMIGHLQAEMKHNKESSRRLEESMKKQQEGFHRLELLMSELTNSVRSLAEGRQVARDELADFKKEVTQRFNLLDQEIRELKEDIEKSDNKHIEVLKADMHKRQGIMSFLLTIAKLWPVIAAIGVAAVTYFVTKGGGSPPP